MIPGDHLTLHVEKPVAGGRMLGRHDGQVVLVAGALPGEIVQAVVDRVDRGVAHATTTAVIEAHPARRAVAYDPRCGGAAYAHAAYPLQLELKRDVVRDALRRIARLDWDGPLAVRPSPETGYRMRARIHLRDGRAGFFLEGTHRVCEAADTGQLLAGTIEALRALVEAWQRAGGRGDADIEVAENIAATNRAMHVELEPGAAARAPRDPGPIPGVTGLSWAVQGRAPRVVSGVPSVADTLAAGIDGPPVRLQRHTQAFFQGNRYLVEPLVAAVHGACGRGTVLDLYAGVGLFGVTLAAAGRRVSAVEGHWAAAADLRANAAPFAEAIDVHAMPVERFLGQGGCPVPDAVVIDPPRSGMTADALRGVLALRAGRLVFVSCDVATFARDLRRCLDAGYALAGIEAFDLFPNTAHVEVLARLERP